MHGFGKWAVNGIMKQWKEVFVVILSFVISISIGSSDCLGDKSSIAVGCITFVVLCYLLTYCFNALGHLIERTLQWLVMLIRGDE